MIRSRFCRLLSSILCILLAAGLACRGQDEGSDKRAVNFPKIKEVAPGVLLLGDVTLDKNKRIVTFPAVINMDHGMLEYFLVQSGGKTHESLLMTKVEPFHLHTAMLLLGAKPPKQNTDSPPPDAIDLQYLKTAPKPQGDGVIIKLKWNEGMKEVEVNGEDLIMNDEKKAPMTRGPWIYNGSMIKEGVFLAQMERSFIALVIDPTALINNTRPGCDDDQIWEVRADKTPKEGTPVEVSIQLQDAATSTPKPQE